MSLILELVLWRTSPTVQSTSGVVITNNPTSKTWATSTRLLVIQSSTAITPTLIACGPSGKHWMDRSAPTSQILIGSMLPSFSMTKMLKPYVSKSVTALTTPS